MTDKWAKWLSIVMLTFIGGFLTGAFVADGSSSDAHVRTVTHYVTETRQTAESNALNQCENQNTGGGAPQYGLCISEVEKAFRG